MNYSLFSGILLFVILYITIYIKFLKKNEGFEINGLTTESVIHGNRYSGICSKLCCFSGWPNSIIINDKNVSQSDIGTKYDTTNYNCNNGFTTGCICNKKI